MGAFYKLLFLVCFVSCKAQTVTIAIENQTSSLKASATYIKDVNNLLNPFEGTWLYENGTTSLLIKLRKVVNYNNGSILQDLLVGDYRYVENGVEKINTLANFPINFPKQFTHEIVGNFIYSKDDIPVCNDCTDNEKRVVLALGDPILDVGARIILRKITVNGQEALAMFMRSEGIKYTGTTLDTIETEFVGSTMPNGNYTLIKQP